MSPDVGVLGVPPGGITLGAQRVYLNAPVMLAPDTLSGAGAHIFLVINGIQFEHPPEAYYEIYLNPPALNQPSSNRIYFVGNLSFFRGLNSAYSQPFDITDLFRLQLETGQARVDVARLSLVLQGVPDAPGAAVEMAPGANVRIAGAVVTDVLPSGPSGPLP